MYMNIRRGRAAAAASLLLALYACGGARAAIYIYEDDRGLVHVTNVARQADRSAAPGAVPRQTGQRYRDLVDEAARRCEINASLIHAVIRTESGYRPDAVSPKGAVGLMQLMPATAQRYGVTDLRDPGQNILGGARYLRDLLGLFDNDLALTLAAYNAGEDAVMRYGGIPPYPETRQYVLKVLAHYERTGAGALGARIP